MAQELWDLWRKNCGIARRNCGILQPAPSSQAAADQWRGTARPLGGQLVILLELLYYNAGVLAMRLVRKEVR